MGAESSHRPPAPGPRAIPIHVSLVRPILLSGADRELVLANGVMIVALVFGIGLSWYTASIAGLLATIGHWGLVALTRHDPQIREIYLRHVQLAEFYPAAPAERMSSPLVHPAVPVSE